MKKLISFLCALGTAAGAVTAAAADAAVLAVFRDGVLVYSDSALKTGENYDFTVPSEFENDNIKVYSAETAECNIIFGEKETEPTPAPQQTAAPATEQPTAAPTAAPAKTPYPEVYEKALDAVNAPAVVLEVSEQITDGETCYVTRMLYQGTEITSNIKDSAMIESAPRRNSELIGQNASALRAGDVIHFTCNLQRSVRSIEFIYRPEFIDYIAAGESFGSGFSELIGSDGYSDFRFGVPVKTAKGYMLLADASGKVSDIDLSPDTFVYAVQKGTRGDKAELAGTGFGAIPKVYIAGGGFDDNDNVISWEGADTSVYVLARIRNGAATEVIVFEN